MQQYHTLLEEILTKGRDTKPDKPDRTGVGTRSIFGYQMRFDLNDGFPLVTTKKVFTKGIIHELLWFLQGSTNIKYLLDNNVHIWDAWADSEGELGPIYGYQWRSWPTFGRWVTDLYKTFEPDYEEKEGDGWEYIDQIKEVINDIKTKPLSRRHIVSAWNVGDIKHMKLPPCHLLFQFDVWDGKLSCQLYQRSCDVALGLPFNIASYAILTHMIAHVCDLEVGELIITLGNAHIYHNHIDGVKEQLKRHPLPLPRLVLNPTVRDIDDFKFDDIKVVDYESHPPIAFPIAV